MDLELIETLAKLGVSGISVFLFFLIIRYILQEHRQERQADAEAWRNELRESRERSERVLEELTRAIQEVTRHL